MPKLLAAFLTSTIVMTSTCAGAATLVPRTDNPGGQSAETSAEQWLQWVFAFDHVVDGGDPLSDDSGQFQNRKQTFPVYMLGGSLGGDVARSFTAQPGKPFFVPLIINACIGGLSAAPPPGNIPCAGADQDAARAAQESVDQLSLTIDGQALIDASSKAQVEEIANEFRVESDLFSVDVAPNNVLGAVPGIYPSSFNYGYFAFVDLDPGLHTLEFGGGSGEAVNSVIATIDVAPIPLPAALPLLAGGLLGLGLVARRRRAGH